MQTWAKRGLKTALFTGGLLMLGTGIASAQENVDPDRPASPLDGSLAVPIRIANNDVATPVGQYGLPIIDTTISTDDLRLREVVGPLLTPARDAAHTGPGIPERTPDPLNGNRGNADVAIPVDVSGNIIGAGGNGVVVNDSAQSYVKDRDVTTEGRHSSLGGNVADIDYALPIQATGNAVALPGSDVESYNRADQHTEVTGDTTTSGSQSTLAGNIAALQYATPVRLNGNAISGGGNARTHSDTTSSTAVGGSGRTSGDDGTLSGNIAGHPLALPLGTNGNALGTLGNAEAVATNGTDTTAGGTRPGRDDLPHWAQTSGNPSTLSGNILQPQQATPVDLDGNATSVVGNTATAGQSDSHARAGGISSTNAHNAALSGNIVDGPLALPSQVAGNGSAVVGTAAAQHDHRVDVQSGWDTHSKGDDSVLSANGVTAPYSGTADLFSNAQSVLGVATASGSNDSHARTGGYNGATGNNAVGSGNIAQLPVAAPVEGYGLATGAVSSAGSIAQEHKVVESGGDPNTIDDWGTVSSNVLTGPVSAPVQLFGDSLGAVANVSGTADNDTTAKAGGNPTANGRGGSASGNIVQAPGSLPTQLFGASTTAVGNGDATGYNHTASQAGGHAATDGSNASLSGNAVSAPIGAATQHFGSGTTAGGNVLGSATNLTSSTAGGTVTTAGDRGSVSGNGVTVPLLPVTQAFGHSEGVAGNGAAAAANSTYASSGGDVHSSGEFGSISGDLLTVPVVPATTVFSDSVAALGTADSVASHDLVGNASGTTQSSGYDSGAGSGGDTDIPVVVTPRVFDVPLQIVGQSLTLVFSHNQQIDTGDGSESGRPDLPVEGDALMQILDLPVFGQPSGQPRTLPAPALAPAPVPGTPQHGLRSAGAGPGVGLGAVDLAEGIDPAAVESLVGGLDLQRVIGQGAPTAAPGAALLSGNVVDGFPRRLQGQL